MPKSMLPELFVSMIPCRESLTVPFDMVESRTLVDSWEQCVAGRSEGTQAFIWRRSDSRLIGRAGVREIPTIINLIGGTESIQE